MKILQVINSLGTGGAEKLLIDTIPLYKSLGIEMDLLLLWDNHFAFTENLKAKQCCKIYILNRSHNSKNIYNPANVFKIKNIIRNYDIVHVHLFPAQYYVVVANMLNKKRAKLVFTEHNTTNTRIKFKIFKKIENFIYRKYDKIICISQEILDIYKKYLRDDLTLQIINNGVDLSKIESALPILSSEIHSSLNNNDVLLIQVSAFRPQKDQKTLIKALLFLPINYKLLLVGEGVKLEECKTFVETQGLSHRIVFLGQRMEIPRLLRSVDIIVLSTFYEGLSLSSIEALASGKPFIASDVSGLREIVLGAGLLFPQGDSKALAQHITNLNDDAVFCKHVVKNCLRRAGQFNIERMVSQHVLLYEKLLDF